MMDPNEMKIIDLESEIKSLKEQLESQKTLVEFYSQQNAELRKGVSGAVDLIKVMSTINK